MRNRRAVALLLVVAVSCSSEAMPQSSGGGSSTSDPSTAATATLGSSASVTSQPATTASTAASTANTPTDATGAAQTTDPTDATHATEAAAPPEPVIPMPEFDPALLPALPAPTVLAGVDPATRATELLAATAPEQADVGSGWVATYTEFGIPVVDATGPTAIGDPVGPGWDAVWSIGALARGSARVPLADLGPLFTLDESASVDPVNLLADLRDAAVSADPREQTFGRFVAGRARVQGGGDFLDPAVTIDRVSFDVATIQLVAWAVARQALVASAAADGAAAVDGAAVNGAGADGANGATVPDGFRAVGRDRSAGRRASTTPCAAAPEPDAEPSWLTWALGVFAGGVEIEGVLESSSAVEQWIEALATTTSGAEKAAKLAAKVGTMIDRLNVIATSVSLAAMINALDIAGAIEPELVRRPEAQDGHQATETLRVFFNAGKLDADNPVLCALSKVANALGIGLALPPNGKGLENVELLVENGTNFGTKIYFADNGDRKRTTDGEGYVRLEVQGKARKEGLPPGSPTFLDEFGVKVSSQIEETTGETLLNVFVSGLAGIAKGAVPAGLEIAKAFHYDLGEVILPFRDSLSGYRLTVNSFWDFSESQLSVGATFSEAKLVPDGAGGYIGTAEASWQTGRIGDASCGLTETADTSTVQIGGVVGADGRLTVTVTYADVALHNVGVCGPAHIESTVVGTAEPLVIVGMLGDANNDSTTQVLSSSGRTKLGTAEYSLVPVTND